MKCKINAWECPYHSCLSEDCQRAEVISNGGNFGVGDCRKVIKKPTYHDYLVKEQFCYFVGEITRNEVYREKFKVD